MPHWRVVFGDKEDAMALVCDTEYRLSARLRAELGACEINPSLGLTTTAGWWRAGLFVGQCICKIMGVDHRNISHPQGCSGGV